MRAAQISEYGDVSMIQVVNAERPTPKEGQVLVDVRAASLNPYDTAVRSGAVKDVVPLELPVTLGGDIAGVVTAVGAGATTLAVGDRVYGQASVVAGGSGAFAEFAAAPADHIAQAPANIDDIQTASLPLVGASALQALTHHIKLQAGQKIFIHGGGGGIGSVAIQVAKHLGAHVATTATGEDITYVKNLGADEVIDYTTHDFAATLHDYDAVFDTVGGDDFTKALGVLKKGGIGVSMIAQADNATVQALNVTAISQFTKVTTTILNELRALVESGAVAPRVGQVFALNDIQQAFTARESGKVHGKVVVRIKE